MDTPYFVPPPSRTFIRPSDRIHCYTDIHKWGHNDTKASKGFIRLIAKAVPPDINGNWTMTSMTSVPSVQREEEKVREGEAEMNLLRLQFVAFIA